jgi:hypothetical protein
VFVGLEFFYFDLLGGEKVDEINGVIFYNND